MLRQYSSKWQRLLKASLIIQVSLLFLCACETSRYQKISGFTQGTTYHLTFELPQNQSVEKVQQAVDVRLQEIDKSLSTYRKDSEISQFNSAAYNVDVDVSEDFINVLEMSRKVYALSGKVFDPTVKPLVDLWGFGAVLNVQSLQKVPDPLAINQAVSRINFDALQNVGKKARKLQDVSIDFNGIAQGYTVDSIEKVLVGMGVVNYMVEIGGEVATRGVSPRQSYWRVGIDKPDVNNNNHEISAKLKLNDAHVSTSGDYRDYYEINGKRYSHTIDPRTGRPVQHFLASVTVIAESVAIADAWCTAFMVLGEEEGFLLAEKLNMAVYFIYRDKNQFSIKSTRAMLPYLE